MAKLAGLPEKVIARAREILKSLEAGASVQPAPSKAAPAETDQLSMLDLTGDAVRRRLEATTLETLTPIEALNLLYELKQML